MVPKTTLLLISAIVVLFIANIAAGSVHIPPADILDILLGQFEGRQSWRYIILESRLPQALTALLAGAALSASGLLLQTTFRNPLAGPDIFGITSGAALGVATVMLVLGGSLSVATLSAIGFAAVLTAALIGALTVTTLILLFSTLVRSNVMLLIVGIMIGYLSSSAVSLMNFFATAEGVRNFLLWGMGSFSGVSRSHLPAFALTLLAGLTASLLLSKPLNTLLFGTQYAGGLGIRVRRIRNLLLLVTGLLVSTVTAYCGPISFIGLATPHLARLILSSGDHRRLLPITILCGAAVALLCNLLTVLPTDGQLLPLNAMTPLIGAPIILYVLLKR